MNKLPEMYVNNGLQISKGMRIFGVLVDELERDDLIAALANMTKSYHDALNRNIVNSSEIRSMRSNKYR